MRKIRTYNGEKGHLTNLGGHNDNLILPQQPATQNVP
jgi:hypothetical protein